MPLKRTKSGWLTLTEVTGDKDVRKASEHASAMEAVRKDASRRRIPRVMFKTQRTMATPPAAPAQSHRNSHQVGRGAPAFHRKLAKRRDATIRHPVDPHEVGEIALVTHQRFPRFQHQHVGHPDAFFDDMVGTHRAPNNPALHDDDRGLCYGSPRVGSRSYRSLTDRPSSPSKLPRDQAALVAVRTPNPPPVTRAASLALAVRGWHAVERGTLPGGPSAARRKFEHLPAWEKTSQAQFSREQAELMLEDSLAGRPSPLGLISSARPSSTGGQQRMKHPLHVGEAAPTELDRNLPSTLPATTTTRKMVPSDVDIGVIRALSKQSTSDVPYHRLNDKGTGLRSQHKVKRALNSSPWSLTMSQLAHTQRLWLAAAVIIQERYRMRKTQRRVRSETDAATIIQSKARSLLTRRALAARDRAALHIQAVERGRVIRSRTAKDRAAKRLERLARQREEAVATALFSANAVAKAKGQISADARQRAAAKQEKMMELQRQRPAERLEKLTLEEEVQQQKESLAAEAACIEAELLQQTMVCYGQNDPFSSDEHEVARFAKDVRTGCVIRCADGITRVVYSLDEARKVISTRSFKNENGRAGTMRSPRLSTAPAAVRAT